MKQGKRLIRADLHRDLHDLLIGFHNFVADLSGKLKGEGGLFRGDHHPMNVAGFSSCEVLGHAIGIQLQRVDIANRVLQSIPERRSCGICI
jgi:hypothetical protein